MGNSVNWCSWNFRHFQTIYRTCHATSDWVPAETGENLSQHLGGNTFLHSQVQCQGKNLVKYQQDNASLWSTVRAPVFRHLRSITEKPMEVYYLDEWIMITLHVVSYIHQYFDTSITVLTNQVWKLPIALFKVTNTGAFTVYWFY